MSQIKSCIKSRWGDKGGIIEADFSQLEVFGLAFLSEDKQLKKDLLDGLDMHCLNASFLFGAKYEHIVAAVDAGDPHWEARRKQAKGPGFLIQYGGGAPTMSLQTGIPQKDCERFIKRYYERYKGVKLWQQANIRTVKLSRRPSKNVTPSGIPAGIGKLKSITGRTYTFSEMEATNFPSGANPFVQTTKTVFLPTKIKNYPVQGFATGDIVPECLGRMFKALLHSGLRTTCLMINTVHDSVLFDCFGEVMEEAIVLIKLTLEDAPKYLKIRFGIDFDMPLAVDIKAGPTWGETSQISLLNS